MRNNIIEWHQAKEFPEERRQDQQKYIDEFLDSSCEMMNGRDLQYYIDKTGKDLNWILSNGKNIDPVIKEVAFMNGGLDEVWDYDPFSHSAPYSDEEDEDDDWDDDSDDETSVDWQPSPEVLRTFRSIINR